MSVLNRYLLVRLTCPTVLRFPFTDRFLRSLPITQLKRFTYLFATKEAINPNWALAMPVLAPLRALLAAPSVTAVNGQHRNTPSEQRLSPIVAGGPAVIQNAESAA
ncbi:MAG TPA: hypothetical protein VJ731_14570 [Terriglobales bacterium]|nr:hypothetical protein [Terriglobales bacterium]